MNRMNCTKQTQQQARLQQEAQQTCSHVPSSLHVHLALGWPVCSHVPSTAVLHLALASSSGEMCTHPNAQHTASTFSHLL